MSTQEREMFILRGKVQRQKLDEDVERILALYNDHGYIQARVESHRHRGGPGAGRGHRHHHGGGGPAVPGG